MSALLTAREVVARVGLFSISQLNYVLRRDGIIETSRSGRGRGGGRMFRVEQLKTIRKSIAGTRSYRPTGDGFDR